MSIQVQKTDKKEDMLHFLENAKFTVDVQPEIHVTGEARDYFIKIFPQVLGAQQAIEKNDTLSLKDGALYFGHVFETMHSLPHKLLNLVTGKDEQGFFEKIMERGEDKKLAFYKQALEPLKDDPGKLILFKALTNFYVPVKDVYPDPVVFHSLHTPETIQYGPGGFIPA